MMPRARSPHDDETTHAQQDNAAAKLSLRIVFGDRAVTRELPERGELLLGRGRGADIIIDDRSLSRTHARIRFDSGAVTLEDLGILNGTRWSGRSLEPR